MREAVNQLLKAFQLSLDDVLFSHGEKIAVRSLVDDAQLSEEEKAYLRNRLFEMAQGQVKNSQALTVLDWLDSATKTLYKPQNTRAVSEAHFSPGDDCLNAILKFLRTAKTSIKLCVFTITDDRISNQIIQCHENGIDVKIISDNDKAYDLGSDIKTLSDEGLAVRIDKTPNHMHHKYAIFDDEVLITGSYNWTRSAASHNHENVLITSELKLVEPYLESFEALWPVMVRY